MLNPALTKPNSSSSWIKQLYLCIAIILQCILASFAVADSAETLDLPPEALVSRLQEGGLVVFFRHMETDRSTEDQHPVNLENCESQRVLSDFGIQQAQTIGQAFNRLAIPVEEVISSPFCRCKDTAELAFGQYRINQGLYFAIALSHEQRQLQTDDLRHLLSKPTAGGNRILISHTGNLREATGLWPKPEGVAFLFEPLSNNQYRVLGRIEPADWPTFNP